MTPAWGTGGMGHIPNGHNGEQGIWVTWAMSPTGAKWYRGLRHRGQWGIPMDNEDYRGISGGMGYKGYGPRISNQKPSGNGPVTFVHLILDI